MSTATSDFNSNIIRSKQVATSALFSDFDLKMELQNGSDDIVPLVDIDAITNAVANLLQTNFGDRPFHPEIGNNINALLFQPADEFTAAALIDEIKTCLRNHEPRVGQIKVMVNALPDQNSFQCTVGYSIISSNIQQELSFYLERLR
tara:strand:+ start:4578 stop:5018 length:441 start_codon:yes stop_codon:yes gene_type:complete